ncbi:replicative DNA helicase [Hydrogenibacillus sp. N12]|uniref:replicative DNA helicase n=1 Tax=Hydrogenibacillus sp. N12 TaxID=2866627 RepID=UPI001C7D1646|nr:replicative DNA helicase [Hydrogenibacillus sp. N12]QZA33005.1 replicative DNA helicase [Hydrogenibacillus sp. N12]
MADGMAFIRTPPHQLEAEQALLGAILLDGEAIVAVSDFVRPDDFYRPAHGKIFAAMLAVAESGEPIDAVTVAAELKQRGALEEIGGAAYLAELQAMVPTAAHAAYYAGIVAEKALLRRLIQAATRIVERAYDEADDVETILAEAEKDILALSGERSRQGFVRLRDILTETYVRLDRLARREGTLTGLASGYDDLDRLTSGLQKSDFIVVAARPSVGKTAFALNIAQNVAVRGGAPVAIFSLEMSSEQLAQRMLAAEAMIDGHKLRTGSFSPDDPDWEKLIAAIDVLSRAPIYIDDTPGLTVFAMKSRLRRLMRETGPLGLIVVDYLQLIAGRGRPGESRQQEISEISRQLKGLAREFEVPLLALSQLSRAVEQRQDKRPMLSDIRESGSIEQDADVVAFLYRDDYYHPDTDEPNVVEVIVAKHRNGPTGKVRLAFLKEYNKFVNLAPAYRDESMMQI